MRGIRLVVVEVLVEVLVEIFDDEGRAVDVVLFEAAVYAEMVDKEEGSEVKE